MLLSPLSLLHTSVSTSTTTTNTNFLICSTNSYKPGVPTTTTTTTTTSFKPLVHATPTPHHITQRVEDTHEEQQRHDVEEERVLLSSSASALASVIRRSSSNSSVDFCQFVDKDAEKVVLPTPDFQRLCAQQLHLFRRIVHPNSILSVYVRPAGSYVMDRLELRRVATYPEGVGARDIVILVGNFNIPTGLRAAEAALSGQQVEFVPEHHAFVFPMVKHPFIVGFLVAESPMMELETERFPFPEVPSTLHSTMEKEPSWRVNEIINSDEMVRVCGLSDEQRLSAVNIAQTLATAYVMDQKAILLQQSSWQNNTRMSNLVEQIRGPLSSIQTLSKMLSTQIKRSEISYDIVEDILVQGNRMKDKLEELQDAIYLTKANIVRYNEKMLKKISSSTHAHPKSMKSQLPYNLPTDAGNKFQNSGEPLSLSVAAKDLEMPMPPLALAPLQYGIRPCRVSEMLSDLVHAVKPLARRQQRSVELRELSDSLNVAVEEPALRQALSNLIEGALLRTHVGGKVEILSTKAPAGGTLVIIDDDGPDMHYMTQMHSLTPFGEELFLENMVEDNMTWNFVAGLTVAREILESYGCVVRVVSPWTADAALGAGGTRVELWLPSFASLPAVDDTASDV